MEPIRVMGNQFTAGDQPILLKGLGVGSWLNLEHFMMGVPGWDGDLRACLNQHSPRFMRRFTRNFFTAEDARYIRSLGINFIRVPINHHLFWDDEQDIPNPFGFAQLSRLAKICMDSGLYFLPDLHTTPGGHNPDWHSECRTGSPQFWAFGCLRRRAVRILGEIAVLLGDCPALLGYDLLNEPVLPQGRAALLNDFYRDAVAAIRRHDANHIIFLEGDRFSMDFSAVAPLDDAQWAYTFHFYPGVWDACLLEAAMPAAQRKEALEGALAAILGTMGGYQGPLLCGEMGYELSCLPTSLGLELTRMTIAALDARGSGWCLWCYKDAGFMGLVYPAADSGWMRLVGSVRGRWDHHSAARLGQAAAEAIGKLCPYPFTALEQERFQFVIRAMVAQTDVTHILTEALEALPPAVRETLPDDFQWHCCARNAGLEALLAETGAQSMCCTAD